MAKTNHKLKKALFGTAIIVLLLCGAYFYYALQLKQVYYYPSYSSVNTITKEPFNLDLGPYPAAVKVSGKDITFSNSEESLPMASTVKLITALSLIDKIGQENLNKLVTVGSKDEAITQSYINKGGSVVRVSAGQTYSYNKALEYLLVVSANNFADILVNSQFSNQAQYIEYANNWLAKNGLNNTVVADTSGFSPKSTTTATDLAKLGQLAIENSTLKQIVSLRQTTLPNGQVKSSTNYFLNSKYGTVAGVKTGNTDEAGYAFVTAVESKDKPTVLASVIKAPSRFISQQEAVENADALGLSYKQEPIFESSQTVLNIDLPWQNNVAILVNDDVSISNIANKELKYSVLLETFTKNTKPGQKIGQLSVLSNLETKQFELYLSDDYKPVDTAWLLTNPLF